MITVFHNGTIYTGQMPLQEAMAVEDDRILRTGSEEEILKIAADRRIDLEGRFVCAGFNDSHMHLLSFGQSLAQPQLMEHTRSLREMIDYLKTFLREHPVPEGGWLRGRGWNQDYFTDVKRMPSRFDLDEISEEIPIMISRTCGHACVVNSRALELCGVTEETPAPEGGAIGMENGKLDGRFYDNAIGLVSSRLPNPDMEEIKDMIRRAVREVNRYGITSVQTDDYCVFREVPFQAVNEAYREIAAEGDLTVRVYEQSNFTSPEGLREFMEEGNLTGTGDLFFRIGPLKMLGDGALGSRTAHLSIPYLGSGGETGFDLFSDEEMDEMVELAHRNGMQIAVHAIGDACLDQVLSAFEKALRKYPRKDHRHGIVHCQISRADQLEKIERLGLMVYAQSVFLDYDNHIVEQLVDPSLAGTSYSWKRLMQHGVLVSNGSDCPVELPDVMKGIQCAVTRRSLDGTGPFLPDQAFTVEEAVLSFTRKGAEASFEEDRKGLLLPGMLADFVVLGEDPFAAEPEKIHEIPVLETWLGGKRVY